ncbi:TolB-like 6-blade propeller-like [Cyclobacterium lianum]|uniref:TolB-like 6-blade propeller-like n=1 Tax=Cyclobacterium lianum TaxID=388280 RepID=A0A1M7QEC1_9BACT|nr:BF3164 family lipoprotein [Cyclobacterium lianum]SHN29206.1 TolB-like 6-blade propeller-like [Cyclobacterium lianum]
MYSLERDIYCKKLLLLPVLALFFLSCQSNDSSKRLISEIPDSGSLVSKEITLDSTVLIPSKMLVFPDKAVIFDNGKEDLFKVYRLPEFTFLYSFGEIGEGPNEFSYVNENSVQAMDDHLVVVSGTNLIKIRLENDSSVMGESVELFMSNGSPVNGLVMIDESTYISDIMDAKPGGPEHQLVHLQRGEELTTFGKFPELSNIENNRQLDRLYRDFGKRTVVNPKDGRLAAFYFFQNQIKYYNHQGELLHEIEIETPPKNDLEEELNMYRVEPFATSTHIYVMYVGKPKSEVMEQPEIFRPLLEIWDWDGILLERFTLDQPLTSFAVSEEFQKLYGFSYFKEDLFFEYDLKGSMISGLNMDKSFKGFSSAKDIDSKKRGQGANPNSENVAENDYYRMELPSGWKYSPSSLEVKNELWESDEMYMTGAIFNSEKLQGNTFCGGASMQVKIAFPKGAAFDFDDYLKSRANRYKANKNLAGLTVKELDGYTDSKGYRINFSNQLTDPNGQKYVSRSEVTLFEKEGRIIYTSFTSCNYEYYYNDVQASLASLTVKDKFPDWE